MEENWNNYSALGYVKLALKNTNCKKTTIQNVIEEMYILFDEMTLEEAKEAYFNK
jgi:F0F1-type ATP synthase membrane subunit a